MISALKRCKGVYSLVDQRFSYVRLAAPLLDNWVFGGEINTQFRFTYSLGVRTSLLSRARATR